MYIAAYQVHTTLLQDATIPPYVGSVFRHAFEKAFRAVSCPAPEDKPQDCFYGEMCAYNYVFDTDRFKEKDKDGNPSKVLIDVPKPFVIETPFATEPYTKKRGDVMIFNMLLVGKAVVHLPLFVLAFKELGRLGFAENKIKFKVTSVQAVDTLHDITNELYSAQTDAFKVITHTVSFKKVAQQFEDEKFKRVTEVKLDFMTPFRVKRTQMALANPEFFVLARPMLRRLMALARFYCDSRVRMDYKQLMDLASQVKIKENKLEWFDWGKFSPKNESKSQIGGLFGSVTYEGPLGEFLPYLIYGQLVHVGKNTTYGLGKFLVDFHV